MSCEKANVSSISFCMFSQKVLVACRGKAKKMPTYKLNINNAVDKAPILELAPSSLVPFWCLIVS